MKREVMASLEGTTASTLWLHDLETFKAVWLDYKGQREEEMKGEGGEVAPTKKKRAIVVRKKAAATVAVKA